MYPKKINEQRKLCAYISGDKLSRPLTDLRRGLVAVDSCGTGHEHAQAQAFSRAFSIQVPAKKIEVKICGKKKGFKAREEER